MPWLTSGRHPPLVGQPGSWGAAEVPDPGCHPGAARSGPSPVRDLCVHAGRGRPDSPWPRRPRTHPVRPPDLLGPNGEAGAHCATEAERASGGPACEAGGGRRRLRGLGAEPQLCILITGNHRWLAAPPAVGGRRTEHPAFILFLPPPAQLPAPAAGEEGSPESTCPSLLLHMGAPRPGQPPDSSPHRAQGGKGHCGSRPELV